MSIETSGGGGRVVMVVMVMVGGVFSVTPPNPDLLALTNDFWDWKIQEFPQFATYIGIDDSSTGRLDSFDMENLRQRKTKCDEFLQRANQIDDTTLSPEDLVTLKVFKEEVTTYTNNFKYIDYFTPVTSWNSPHIELKDMVNKELVFDSYSDYENLLARYAEFPRQNKEILELMKGNIANGIMPSNWSMNGVVDVLDEMNVSAVESSEFYKPFVNLHKSITPEQRTTLRQQAKERIEKDLLPSFRELKDFLVNEYLSNTRSEVGVSSLPLGDDYYQACLKFHTNTDLAPQEIYNMGRAEVARVEKEVQKTAAVLGMEGKTFAEISQALRNNPAQMFTSTNNLLESFKSAVYNVITPRVEAMFPNYPPTNISIVVDDNPQASGARYSSPSQDGSRLGSFIISPYQKRRRYEVIALSLHEAIPGHHLYTIYRQMNPKTPTFRKHVDFTFVNTVPARFPMYTFLSEGWALYAEYLGEELGLYQDPYQKMGRHSFELLRASRLVVDTGMHALGWSREKAVQYLMDHTAMTEESIQGQINRYISWPGQACAYKVGEMKIKELRDKAEKILANEFVLVDFHDSILRCIGPFNVVEECVDRYIEGVQNKDENDNSGNGVIPSVMLLVVCWMIVPYLR